MDDLDRLFAAYRDALPDQEPSAAFTPGVWQRIEANRPPVRFLRRLTQALVTLSAVVALFLGAYVIPRMQASAVYSATYVDILDGEQSADTLAYAAVVHDDPTAETPLR